MLSIYHILYLPWLSLQQLHCAIWEKECFGNLLLSLLRMYVLHQRIDKCCRKKFENTSQSDKLQSSSISLQEKGGWEGKIICLLSVLHAAFRAHIWVGIPVMEWHADDSWGPQKSWATMSHMLCGKVGEKNIPPINRTAAQYCAHYWTFCNVKYV